MQLTREAIQRMIDGQGSGGSGGGGISASDIAGLLAGYATEDWVNENYLSIAFFSKLFKAYNGSTLVNPNDTTSTINNIKAMFGFWTEQYISSLGQNSGGGGGGVTLNEPLNGINNAGLASHPSVSGQTIMWNGSTWVYGNTGSGVTSIGMEVPTGLIVSGVPITSSGTIALSYATGYGIPLTADVGKGVTAYGWGNHANAGYLTSVAFSDLTSHPTTLSGYGITDALDDSTSFWGQTESNGSVSGSMTDVGSISMNGTITGARGLELNTASGHGADGGFIDFHFNGNSGDYTSRIIEDVSGRIQFVASNGIRIGNGVIIWDSTGNALKVQKNDGTAANIYATGGISALGLTPGTAGSIANLTVENYLYLSDTNNYLKASSTSLQIVSNGPTTINGNTSVSSNGNTLTTQTLSATTGQVNTMTVGTSLSAATIEIYHNGTRYYFNKAAAISAGILTTSNG